MENFILSKKLLLVRSGLKKAQKSLKAFTIIEILLVVTIICLLTAITIPNLVRVRNTAQEQLTGASLRAIVCAQFQWRATHSSYTNLTSLYVDELPYIDSILASGNKQGYTFVSFAVPGATKSQFIVTSQPHALNRAHTFYIDEDAFLCRSNTTNTPAPTNHTAAGCPPNFSLVK